MKQPNRTFLLCLFLTLIATAAANGAAPKFRTASGPEPVVGRYLVTLDSSADSDTAAATAEALARAYAGHLEPFASSDVRQFAITMLPARARTLSADPRVREVIEIAQPDQTAVPPSPSTAAAGLARQHLVPVAQDSTASGDYLYDGSGNIKFIGSDSFTYDSVGRLKVATVQGNQQSYDYDAFGNRKSATRANLAVGCAGGTNCEAIVTVLGQSNHLAEQTYDEAGNVKTGFGAAYTYDGTGMVTGATVGSDVRDFVYTADDERIAVRNGLSWTWNVRDQSNKVLREFTSLEAPSSPLALSGHTWSKDYVWRDGQLLAAVSQTASGPTTYHYHLDHLGTPLLITGNGGFLIAKHAYYPFGAEMALTPTESSVELMKFTGHERDVVAGNNASVDYMHARYYNANLGRLLSVDPSLEIEKAQKQPQRWNRYTYVTNNPMRYVDPDGRDIGFLDYASAVWEATKQTVDDAAFEVAKPFLIWGRGIQTDNLGMVAKGTGMLVADGALGALGEVGVGRIAMGFTSRANLLAHFEKHGAEFGFKLAEQYGAAASRFAATAGKEGVQAVTTKSGEKLVYNAATKEFAVVNKSGEVVTYFKANAKYWANQVRKTADELGAVAK
jgi:RHS repeat-associated protein